MKTIILLLAIVVLNGCATTWKNSAGETMPKSVEFDCKQKCGYYNSASINPFMLGQCLAECQNSQGYRAVRE